MTKRILQVAVALAVVVAAGFFFFYGAIDSPEECDVCYRPMHAETFYRIHLANGETKDACCPRCGLRFQEGRDDVVGVEVTDFYSRKLLDATSAFYVEGSPVHFCSHAALQEDRSGAQYEVAWDRCLPSLVGFASREDAEEFQSENGGTVRSYDELLAEHS